MKNIRRRIPTFAAIAIVMIPLLATMYLLYWCSVDQSARQTGKQRVFGAIYMTMNDPYFQMLDAQIQGHLELHGDVLLTRDAAMDQERQNQEIQDPELAVCSVGACGSRPLHTQQQNAAVHHCDPQPDVCLWPV